MKNKFIATCLILTLVLSNFVNIYANDETLYKIYKISLDGVGYKVIENDKHEIVYCYNKERVEPPLLKDNKTENLPSYKRIDNYLSTSDTEILDKEKKDLVANLLSIAYPYDPYNIRQKYPYITDQNAMRATQHALWEILEHGKNTPDKKEKPLTYYEEILKLALEEKNENEGIKFDQDIEISYDDNTNKWKSNTIKATGDSSIKFKFSDLPEGVKVVKNENNSEINKDIDISVNEEFYFISDEKPTIDLNLNAEYETVNKQVYYYKLQKNTSSYLHTYQDLIRMEVTKTTKQVPLKLIIKENNLVVTNENSLSIELSGENNGAITVEEDEVIIESNGNNIDTEERSEENGNSTATEVEEDTENLESVNNNLTETEESTTDNEITGEIGEGTVLESEEGDSITVTTIVDSVEDNANVEIRGNNVNGVITEIEEALTTVTSGNNIVDIEEDSSNKEIKTGSNGGSITVEEKTTTENSKVEVVITPESKTNNVEENSSTKNEFIIDNSTSGGADIGTQLTYDNSVTQVNTELNPIVKGFEEKPNIDDKNVTASSNTPQDIVIDTVKTDDNTTKESSENKEVVQKDIPKNKKVKPMSESEDLKDKVPATGDSIPYTLLSSFSVVSLLMFLLFRRNRLKCEQ